MYVFLYTHRGNRRESNEDALAVCHRVVWGTSMECPESMDIPNSTGLFAVVDGMGGYEGGALAAQLVAEILCQECDVLMAPSSEEEKETLLRRSLDKAAEMMRIKTLKNAELSSMGVTLGGLLLDEENAFVFNCGDCRVYRFAEGSLTKVSHDHSQVQELVDAGMLDEEKMRFHVRKNVVTSAIQAGVGPSATPFFFARCPRVPGELFFLCSDGVWESLASAEIAEILAGENLQKLSDALGKKLLGTECRDNISFLIIKP